MSSAPALTEAEAAALGEHLRVVRPDLVDASMHAENPCVTPLTGGRSNPTYRVTWGSHTWVLRRPPAGDVPANAHDMSREYRVLSALAETDVPVPQVVTLCDDPSVIGAGFMLMEFLPGRTIASLEDAERLGVEERSSLSAAVTDVMTTLHLVDVERAGLASFGRPAGFVERQLHRWKRQWEAVRPEGPSSFDALHGRLLDTLPSHRTRTGLVHGDFKIDNVMVSTEDVGSVTGLLDWELSALGDPLVDLGWLISHWDEPGREPHPMMRGTTALPGFWSARDLVEAYARATGDSADEVEWFVGFADLKLAVIYQQIHRRRELAGLRPGEENMGAMVAPLLDRSLLRDYAL